MNEPILVQKYGGSSVANPQRLICVARRVVEARKAGYGVVVVVSAMGNSTDRLMAMANEVSSNPTRRELDMLLSTGERTSMALLSMAIQDQGYEAISFTGSQCGILTNDRHFDAKIIEVRPVRIQDELARGKVVIVAGFQGMSYKREITTLGRGGSDTTAVALAAALNAEACEICSDVDGVYNADPRIVPEAKRFAELSYEEMETLARAGAKVLHADAIAWAKEKGVALYARATSKPFGEGGGTLIRVDRDLAEAELQTPAIACAKDVFWLSFSKTPISEIYQWLTSHCLVPLWTEWSNDEVHLFFRQWENAEFEKAFENIPQSQGQSPSPRDVSGISLIGESLTRDVSWIQKSIEALQQEPGIPLHKIYTEALRISFIVPSDRAEEAQTRLFSILGS